MRIPARKITPKDVYLTRRRLLAALGRARRCEPLQHRREGDAAQ